VRYLSIKSASICARWCAVGMLMVLLACCKAVAPAHGSLPASKKSLTELAAAVGFVANYKEVAAVSARVYAKRGQGSDAQTAAVMSKVAASDLTSAEPCIVRVYELPAFTDGEARQLTEFFTSALGSKLLAGSQRMQLASIEALSLQRADASMFTADEKQQLAAIYQTPAFRKYGQMAASRDAARAMLICIYRAAGIDLSGMQ
jgi:hypothetical protein